MEDSLIYEFPLNEKMRTLLRLEQQFIRFRDSLIRSQAYDAQSAVATLVEIYQLLEYSAADKILLEEQLKYHRNLERLAQTPSVDIVALNNILAKLKSSTEALRSFNFYQVSFMKSELFKSYTSRMPLPGGTMCFDTPLLHYWLQQSTEQHQEYCGSWVAELQPVESGLLLLLHLIRQCHYPKSVVSKYGHFKQPLKQPHDIQLIKIEYDNTLAVYPKFSGSKHRVNIQFFNGCLEQKIHKTTHQDIPFELTLCSLS
jgi:cell division protein ZapD